jgi:hypothetical protein
MINIQPENNFEHNLGHRYSYIPAHSQSSQSQPPIMNPLNNVINPDHLYSQNYNSQFGDHE